MAGVQEQGGTNLNKHPKNQKPKEKYREREIPGNKGLLISIFGVLW
jgi:hypothetical protein